MIGAESYRSIQVRWLGRARFQDVLEQQLSAREALIAGEGPPILFLVEHPRVLTIGRRGKREDVLWTDAQIAEHGVEIVETPRGGEVTLHAPGQLVAYPVLHVGRKIRAHLEHLGAATVAVLEELGVEHAEFHMENPGVWIDGAKIASVGVHISRGVAVQGLSVNLAVDPALFGALVSCGMAGVQMVSAVERGAGAFDIEQVARRWALHFGQAAKLTLDWATI